MQEMRELRALGYTPVMTLADVILYSDHPSVAVSDLPGDTAAHDWARNFLRAVIPSLRLSHPSVTADPVGYLLLASLGELRALDPALVANMDSERWFKVRDIISDWANSQEVDRQGSRKAQLAKAQATRRKKQLEEGRKLIQLYVLPETVKSLDLWKEQINSDSRQNAVDELFAVSRKNGVIKGS